MKFLQPVRLQRRHYSDVEEQINDIFAEVIYDPIRKVMKRHGFEIKNSYSPLISALSDDSVFYSGGAFYGHFNAKISRELRALGAMWDGRKKAWIIAEYLLPPDIQRALRDADLRFHLFKNDILNVINTIDQKPIPPINYRPSVDEVNADLIKTLKSASVPTILSPRAAKIISEQWGENLDLYIKGWVSDNIIKLRKEVMEVTLAGGRAESLHQVLRDNYGTSKSKAKFLARQETSLLMSMLREESYEDVGIGRYRWRCVGGDEPDERVRELHKLLNGKIFAFKNPPPSGTKGERLNAGEPFGCRCAAEPIVESAFDKPGEGKVYSDADIVQLCNQYFAKVEAA
jgi:SPP1 gp7 family putative phage head morphogenesis protein